MVCLTSVIFIFKRNSSLTVLEIGHNTVLNWSWTRWLNGQLKRYDSDLWGPVRRPCRSRVFCTM